MKNARIPMAFKTRVKEALVANAFYNADDCMAPNLET